jgi:transposase
MIFDFTQTPLKPESLDECHRVIDDLWTEFIQLQNKYDKIAKILENAEEKLQTNSHNSSKPPSTDIYKKKKERRYPKARKKSTKKQGAQPDHKGKGRKLMATEDVDDVVVCLPPSRCQCGGSIKAELNKKKRHQVHELPIVKPIVTEYQRVFGRCACCDKHHFGDLPVGVPSGMLGVRAIATIATHTGKYHMSKRMTQVAFADHYGLEISVGTVSNAEKIASDALEKPTQEVLNYIQGADVKHADETGHKQKGNKRWMWVAATLLVAVFLIRTTRATVEAKALLGEEFRGILISDRYSSYTWIDDSQRQFCWAHLLRDFIKISERSGKSGQIGEQLLAYSRRMFKLWWRYRDGNLSRAKFILVMKRIQEGLEETLEAGTGCGHRKTEGTCKKIVKHKIALWTFVTEEGVEPTNNRAEQIIRGYVMWRKTSFGTQSDRGDRYVERIMTASTCCRLQDRNLLKYLSEAIFADISGEAYPSLLPLGEVVLEEKMAA